MFILDGNAYNAEWVHGAYEQTADILNGDDSGRLAGTKDMYLQYVGTFINSTGTLIRGKNCSDAEWDNLFIALANPINDHTIRVPFNQGYLTRQMYIASAKRNLVETVNGRNIWSKKIEVQFTSMSSEWPAGANLRGYSEGV